jgi:hypothetical protein
VSQHPVGIASADAVSSTAFLVLRLWLNTFVMF